VHRKELISVVGEWRDYRTIGIDPEADLYQRMDEAGFQLKFVPRFTAVKFPAAARRNVYKQRPCHEQQEWSRRIETENDFEVRELPAMMLAAQSNGVRIASARPYYNVVKEFLNETFSRVRILASVLISGKRHNGNMIEYRKRFKGVESSD
jgi:hypothetical protein